MSIDQALLAGPLNAWTSVLGRADKLFTSLSDEQLDVHIAPGKNRLIYLLGHLTAIQDRMVEMIFVGERQHPEYDALFLTSPDGTAKLPPAAELRAAWTAVNARLNEGIATLSPADWLTRHSAVSEEDFAKEPHRNRLSLLLSRTNHLSYHLGQIVLRPK